MRLDRPADPYNCPPINPTTANERRTMSHSERPHVYVDDEIVYLKTNKIVCPRCHGEGTHINPSIDGHGISGDDECWDDEDFRRMYFGGGYDVVCERCNGANVVDEVDEDANPPELLALWFDDLQAQADDAHMRWMESGCPR
jgi:hypothetical protein